jgi:RNA polymerase sigma factor (sigma-70 family)
VGTGQSLPDDALEQAAPGRGRRRVAHLGTATFDPAGARTKKPLNGMCLSGVLGAVLVLSVAHERVSESAPITVDARPALSFEAFYMAYERRLFRALYVLAGDRHEAEDLAQLAFCRVWERWGRVERLDDPAGYLFRTAFNARRSATRRTMRAARRLVDHAFVHPIPTPTPEPAEVAADRDSVARALAALTPRQREAVVLTELLDCTTGEAAHVMGIRPATVRVLVSQARAALAPDPGRGREPGA